MSSEKCNYCRHGPMAHHSWWNKLVANPIKKFGYVGKGNRAMRVLKQHILARVLLRRTKVDCADVLALPPRCVLGNSARQTPNLMLSKAQRCDELCMVKQHMLARGLLQHTKVDCADVLALPPRCVHTVNASAVADVAEHSQLHDACAQAAHSRARACCCDAARWAEPTPVLCFGVWHAGFQFEHLGSAPLLERNPVRVLLRHIKADCLTSVCYAGLGTSQATGYSDRLLPTHANCMLQDGGAAEGQVRRAGEGLLRCAVHAEPGPVQRLRGGRRGAEQLHAHLRDAHPPAPGELPCLNPPHRTPDRY